MPEKYFSFLHGALTNQLVILGAAIVLFLLVITLVDPGESQAVVWDFWI
ncbi:MAG: hypothetical protein WC443_00145 [Desulfobaccales bacterium]